MALARVTHPIAHRASSRRPALFTLTTALAAVLLAQSVAAHGPPTPLNFWGAFGRRVASCQRAIGRAAAVCALHAWAAARDCRLATMRGGVCDEAATDDAIEAARLHAFDVVQNRCTESQALTLVFLGRGEAQTDVIQFCRQLEDAAVSAVFLPLADEQPSSPAEQRCVEAAALATTKLLRHGFDSRQHLLDRIAQRAYAPAEKQARLAASTANIGAATAALTQESAADCSSTAFAESYGRDAASFLSLIATRADCLADATYAQGGVLCPEPSCGNGMVEGTALRDEGCDDGNVVAGDGCSATCTRE
jgi:cysteine-rich repeat protein